MCGWIPSTVVWVRMHDLAPSISFTRHRKILGSFQTGEYIVLYICEPQKVMNHQNKKLENHSAGNVPLHDWLCPLIPQNPWFAFLDFRILISCVENADLEQDISASLTLCFLKFYVDWSLRQEKFRLSLICLHTKHLPEPQRRNIATYFTSNDLGVISIFVSHFNYVLKLDKLTVVRFRFAG